MPLDALVRHCTFFAAGDKWRKHDSVLNRPHAAAATATAASVTNDGDCDDDSASASALLPIRPVIEGVEALSVSMSERKQRDVSGAHYCGARTLFVAASDGVTVLLRGANKFFDLPIVFAHAVRMNGGAIAGADLFAMPILSDGASSPHPHQISQVLALRKAAGFFCAVFFDRAAGQLRCASKHALVGVHVDAATAALRARLSEQQLATLGARLAEMDAALLCECIGGDAAVLGHHPVEDADLAAAASARGAAQLLCFALQKRSTVVELSFPHAALVRVAHECGLDVVPTVPLGGSATLGAAIFDLVRRAALPCSAAADAPLRGEGVVLLLETAAPAAAPLCRPIRLKIKAATYQMLRQLRGLLVDGSAAANGLCPLAAATALWLVRRASMAAVMDARTGLPCGFESWEAVLAAFAAAVPPSHAQLLSLLQQDACDRHRTALLSPRVLVLLVGLPATGKGSVAAALGLKLRAAAAVDQFHVVEKDCFVPQLPPGSSAHAQRAARRSAHRGFFRTLRSPAEFLPCGGLQVVAADACHASAGARQTTRECCAPFRRCATVFLACADRKLLVRRIVRRTGHAVLRDGGSGETAEKAIFDVASALEVPRSAEDESDVLLRFDVDGDSPPSADAIANAVVQQVIGPEGALFQDDWRRAGGGDVQRASPDVWWQRIHALASAACPDAECSVSSVAQLVALCCPPQRRVTSVRLVAAQSGSGHSEWLEALRPALAAALAAAASSPGGHAQWVRHYFLQAPRGEHAPQPPPALLDAILQRLGAHPDPLHVTLRHVNDGAPAGASRRPIADLERWLAAEREGALFRVLPTHVLLDRRMLAVRVAVAPVRADGGEAAAAVQSTPGTFLHITLAHSDKVPPAHVLTRFATVVESGARRGRDEVGDTDGGAGAQQLSGRQKKKAAGDTQLCILPITDAHPQPVPLELFGVVECV